jgi:hypothetical protein
MQSISGQGPINNLNPQSRTIAVIAIILFALAGLISGFAVGAFIRPGQQQQANNQNQTITPPTQGQSNTPTVSHPQRPLPMGFPVIDDFKYSEIANGSTTYSVLAHAVDKKNQPLHKQGITCKLWLTQDGNVSANMPTSRLKAIDSLNQPFPEEMQGALNFDTATSQTQACNNGQGKWNYTLSPSVEDGKYYLVILMDWSGVHYNWSWVQITIKKED